jgi:hypothetical protein
MTTPLPLPIFDHKDTTGLQSSNFVRRSFHITFSTVFLKWLFQRYDFNPLTSTIHQMVMEAPFLEPFHADPAAIAHS